MSSKDESEVDSAGTDIRTESSGTGHWRAFGIFVASTFAFSWGLWIPLLFGQAPSSLTTPLIILGGFGPFVGALITLRFTGRSIREWLRSNLRYRIPLRWYAIALAVPPLFIIAGSVVYVSVFDASFALDELAPIWMFPLALVLTFFLGGGQEELGWRGLAQPALQAGVSALSASLLVGVVWFVWHVPLFYVPGSSQFGLPMIPYAVAVTATAVVLGWLYNSSRSLLVPWLYHASLNPAGTFFLAGVAGLKTAAGYGSYAVLVATVAIVLIVYYGPTNLAARTRIRLSELV